jgi:arginase family enzyme
MPGLLRAERADDVFTLHLAAHGTSIDVAPESAAWVEQILEGFAEPNTIDAFVKHHPEVPVELLGFVLASCLIVRVDELPFLEHGFLKPTPAPIGEPWSFSDVEELAFEGGSALLGVPSDVGALGPGGARHGPEAIRRALNTGLLFGEGDILDHELGRTYRGFQARLCDLGDVDPDGGRLEHVGLRLRKVVRELWRAGMRPLLLGGDHALTHFVLEEAVLQHERFGVIHFDAHHDLVPSRVVSHANAFRVAIESERVTSFVQLGVSGIERVTPYARADACKKRTLVTAREVMRGKALAVLEGLPKDMPYYLSFDVDCIDGSVVRETGTPSLGGIGYPEALELVDHVARNFELLGADFVEVSGEPSLTNTAAKVAASLLTRVLFGKHAFKPLTSDVYTLGG